MRHNIIDIGLDPFPQRVNYWLDGDYNPFIMLKLGFLYFEKIFANEMDIRLPLIQVSELRNQKRYPTEDVQAFEEVLEAANETLFTSLVEWSSFEREYIDLTGLEEIWGMESKELLELDDGKRVKFVLRSKDKLLNQKQQELFFLLPHPVLNSIDYLHDRTVIYLYSRKLAAYLIFSRENDHMITNQFKHEHKCILQALEGVRKPLWEDWIPEMFRESKENYIIGFYFGVEMDGELSLKSINWNFFVCLYVLEKLLELADSFFHFYN